MKSFLKELPLLLIVAAPFVYLAYIWNALPAEVPIHWNIHGEADRFGSKVTLTVIPFLLPFLMYLLFYFIPKIDPKQNIDEDGSKYYQLRFIVTMFMSILAIFILYSAASSAPSNMNILWIILGGLFMALGNYFKTIKPNYFVGIRTPWTLENEEVWKQTHQVGGLIWFVGGALMIAAGVFLPSLAAGITCLVVILVLTVATIWYSYNAHKRLVK